jgi:hypothetical protein
MSKYKPKEGDEVFWEDQDGKLQKGTVGGVDKSEVLLMETYTWEKTSSFINPDILKAKLENAKKIIHDIELVNDRKRRQEWREAKKVVEWLEGKV